VRLQFITEDSLVSFLSKQYAMPAITVAQVDPDSGPCSNSWPEQIAKKHSVLPIKRIGNVLTLAMADPTNVFALDDVGFMDRSADPAGGGLRGGHPQGLRASLRDRASVNDMISELEEADTDGRGRRGRRGGLQQGRRLRPQGIGDEAPVVRLINMILTDAIRRGASDIHLEPYEKVFRVRFRIDGVLHEIMTPPKRLEAALTRAVKIMATMDIAERRLPQDGRIKLRYHQRERSTSASRPCRRSSVRRRSCGSWTRKRSSSTWGPRLRPVEPGAVQQGDPQSLRHDPDHGPTGSGKTTTLYSAIHVRSCRRSSARHAGEGASDLVVDLHLVDALQVVLRPVLGGMM